MRRYASILAFCLSLPLAAQQQWIGAWAASPVSAPAKLNKTVTLGAKEMTLRETVHLNQGGTMMRITLTNEFGKAPLTISSVHFAMLASSGAHILVNTDHALTFAGNASVTIPAGQFMASDPIKLTVPVFSDLVISLVVPAQKLDRITAHSLALSTTFIGEGNQQSAESLQGTVSQEEHWYLLKDVEVNANKHSAAVVTLGDSITDGAHSTVDTNRRWPDVLAARLTAITKTEYISVLNQGISGNRVLKEVAGPSALDRLDRDVLAMPGVKWVVLLEGINDIGKTVIPKEPNDPITTEQLIDGYKQIIQRVHAKGLKIYGATLTPFGGAKYYSEAGEKMRQAANAFIRTPGNFDGVIDFDKAVEDKQNPGHFDPKYDCGDHLHPSDAGYLAMGTAIDLKLFHK